MGDLEKAIGSLLCKVNRITCNHRHGQPVRDKDLTVLSNYQIDFEKIFEAWKKANS